MGSVWQAIDRTLSVEGAPAPVALKFIGRGSASDPAAIRFLRREMEACRGLTHPNIVRVYSWHEHPGEPVFYAMEYVDGQDLRGYLAGLPARRVPVVELDWILEPMLDALDHAHTKAKIIHRDLKPANVMLQVGGAVKLADFGLARGPGRDESGTVLRGGTIGYSSPQQRRGEVPQISDDIYSLGATLYQILTGESPFTGSLLHLGKVLAPNSDPGAVIGAQCRNLPGDLPKQSAQTLLRCLDQDPAERPRDIATFRQWWKHGPTNFK